MTLTHNKQTSTVEGGRVGERWPDRTLQYLNIAISLSSYLSQQQFFGNLISGLVCGRPGLQTLTEIPI